MNTELYMMTGDALADHAALVRAAEYLRAGELVAFPTETVYGLGASAYSEDAAQKVYAAKGRPSDNPLIVHISDAAEAESLAYTTPTYYQLAKHFMPGPLTIILPKKKIIPDSVTGGLDSVAIRCPVHPVANALIRICGIPIAAPSANRSGRPSPTTAQHVWKDMNGRIPMIVDGGSCSIGVESTVIRLTDAGCEILRPGAVTEQMLAAVVGTASVSPAVIHPSLAGDKPLSPGMKYKHYAPAAEVVLVDGEADAFVRYVREHILPTEAVAAADTEQALFDGCHVLSLGKNDSAEEEAKYLFALLRQVDDLGYTRVYLRLPPTEGEYLAVYNRLIRAAGGKIVHAD